MKDFHGFMTILLNGKFSLDIQKRPINKPKLQYNPYPQKGF